MECPFLFPDERMSILTEENVTEDVEVEETEQTETPDPIEFDLIGALSGRDLPEDTKDILIDEAGAYALSKLDKAIRKAEILSKADDTGVIEDELAELHRSRDALIESLRESVYTFRFRGVLRETRENILEEATKQFPNPKPGKEDTKVAERDRFYRNKLVATHIVDITDPNGVVFNKVDPDYVDALFKKLPDPGPEQIASIVGEFASGVRAGFESATKSSDFLS